MPALTIEQDRTDQPHQAQPHALTLNSDLSDSGSLAKALDDDDNVLVPMRYPLLREAFFTSLESKRDVIEAAVRLHLGVRHCHLGVREVWSSGSFNVALPIFLSQNQIVYMRIPLPYRVGEAHCPGNVEEKLQTEIATYMWLRENCPDVPIPELHAFGLPDGSTVKLKLIISRSWPTLVNMRLCSSHIHSTLLSGKGPGGRSNVSFASCSGVRYPLIMSNVPFVIQLTLAFFSSARHAAEVSPGRG